MATKEQRIGWLKEILDNMDTIEATLNKYGANDKDIMLPMEQKRELHPIVDALIMSYGIMDKELCTRLIIAVVNGAYMMGKASRPKKKKRMTIPTETAEEFDKRLRNFLAGK